MTNSADDEHVQALAIDVFRRLSGQTSDAPEARIKNAAEKLAEARLCFSNVSRPGYALPFAMAGAQNILSAALELVGVADLPSVFPDQCADLSAMIVPARPIVSEAVGGRMHHEKIYFGFACVNALLSRRNDPLRNDRLNYAAVFVSQLTTEIHIRAVNKRGCQLLRDFAIRRAAESNFDQTSMVLQ